MATYTGTTQIYDSWLAAIAKGSNIALDTVKVALVTSAYTPNLATHDQISDITNECSGNGYARQTLANVSFNVSGGVAKFLADSFAFTASGGSIVARRYVIWNDTTGDLICTGLIDSGNNDVTITDGNALTVNVPAGGLFTLG